jgi:hypothetical protein
MRTPFRRFFIFVPPTILGILNTKHPMVQTPYRDILPHLHWWLHLHFLNLILFPLFGLAAYLLIQGLQNFAATISRIAIALFVPFYAAFDAITGIGTGVLVHNAVQLPANQLSAVESMITAYWNSPVIYGIAAAASIAWVIAMISAAFAFTTPERRRLASIVAVIIFMVGGWARTNIFFAADGMTITLAWWLVTIGMSLTMFLVCKPRIPAAFLVLAGALFGALHIPPTGPLGVLCFLIAAAYLEFAKPTPQSEQRIA